MNLVLALTLLVPAVSAFAQPSVETALNALRSTRPSVSWDEKSAVVADVTCDGIPDTLLIGYQPDKVWLGVVNVTRRKSTSVIATFAFLIGKPAQDSFCAVPVRIETAPIDCDTEEKGALQGCKPIKGCREFSLLDGACDSFHFYWDSARKRLTWWRR